MIEFLAFCHIWEDPGLNHNPKTSHPVEKSSVGFLSPTKNLLLYFKTLWNNLFYYPFFIQNSNALFHMCTHTPVHLY